MQGHTELLSDYNSQRGLAAIVAAWPSVHDLPLCILCGVVDRAE